MINTKSTVVLDVTNEFSKKMDSEFYLTIPTWDGTPSSVTQLNSGIEFLLKNQKKGPILIHCGYGRGRSALMMVCYLVAAGYYNNWEESFKYLKETRPRVRLGSEMKEMAIAWEKQRK